MDPMTFCLFPPREVATVASVAGVGPAPRGTVPPYHGMHVGQEITGRVLCILKRPGRGTRP
jgi:hypothetical protein